MDLDKDDLLIYVDGSCRHKPRRGGIGIRIVHIDSNGDEVPEDIAYGGYKGVTNNEMELKACVEGLKVALGKRLVDVLPNYNKIVICSDSQYVCANFDNAKYRWPKNGWLSAAGKPILNAKLWLELDGLSKKIWKKSNKPVEFKWIEGHKNDIHNKAVDKMAKQSSDLVLYKPLTERIVRRKTVEATVSEGSVQMRGQDLLVRIVERQSLPIQKVYRYRYEVLDAASPYFGNVDFACSEFRFKAGQFYIVTFNTDSKNPRIVDFLSEVVDGE